jgi:hypothetical protein
LATSRRSSWSRIASFVGMTPKAMPRPAWLCGARSL